VNQEDLSVGITGFIDILGFGEKVKNAQTLEDIDSIRASIKKIQNEFDFETQDDLTSEVQRLNGATVLAFSDCIVVNVPLKSESTKYSGSFDPIMSELAGFAYAQGNCVQNSLFIRGGLELGWWYQDGHTLISSSMVGAVKREESACVPVIALCEEIYKYFSEHSHRNFYSEDIDPVSGMFKKYISGQDEYFYIDYISICVEALDWHRSTAQMAAYRQASPDEKDEIMASGYRENVDIWLSTHARNIESAARSAPNDKVKDKYRWLASYHNDVARGYSTSEGSICQV
jgi:hypothetical protein